jgi:hypothetical protein
MVGGQICGSSQYIGTNPNIVFSTGTTATTITTFVNTVSSGTYYFNEPQTCQSAVAFIDAYAKAILEQHGHKVLTREIAAQYEAMPGNAFDLPKDAADYRMPDGSKISVDASGNYQIDDKSAKVIYKANRIREFNPYVSASDLLEKFIEEAGRMGVEQTRMLKLPVEAFINWLVREAAKRDGDSLSGLPQVEPLLLQAAA